MFARQVAPGIEMRLFAMEDAEELFAVVEENRSYLREWLPWVDPTASPAAIRGFIQRVHNQFEANQGPQMALRADGHIAGSLGCHPIDWPNRHCSIGYWIAARYQGRGIVTRACASLLDYLFGELELHRVTIQCATGNHPSRAVAQRLGFVHEGVLRQAEWVNDRWLDLEVWGMLGPDWAVQGGNPAKKG